MAYWVVHRIMNFDFSLYDISVKVREEKDIVIARQMAKDLAKRLGFSIGDTTKISTAVSELARNIFRYAKEGFIYIRSIVDEGEHAIEIVAKDNGPGIADIDIAIKGGFSTTKNSLGLGLSGVKKLMDKFYIESELGKGTLVYVYKRRRTF